MSPVFSDGRQVPITPNGTLFDYADMLKVRVPTSCGRTGECHECIVEIKKGSRALNDPTPEESFLREGYRLACKAIVSDVKSDIEFSTLRRQPRILTSGIKRKIDLDPRVIKKDGSVISNNVVLDSYRGSILGLAGDIGTTTVVLNLVDLETGETLITSSFENPQRFGGADVMNRISYDGGAYPGELQQVMLSSINFEIGSMTKECGVHRRQIYDVVLVGNTTMRDITFGIDVQSIGEKPYKSLIQRDYESSTRKTTTIECDAKTLGLRVHPKSKVYSGPLVSSHIGSDVAADMLAISLDETCDPIMLVDVGTNTEVVIGNKYGMVAASCPAGPAFEGGQVTYGMPGYDGAVESVEIEGDTVTISTIGKADPEGICGSGIVDLLSELRRNNIMNELGAFNNGSNKFTFASEKDMYLDRSDISALAQAKSANYSGQYIALRHYGKSIDEIEKLFLAGGFANYVNSENAKSIGFISNFPSSKIEKIGNSSLEGATLMLKSTNLRSRIEELVKNVSHIELETTPDFFDIFVEGCMFKEMPKEIS